MAPATRAPTSSSGANPAPNYLASMNSIQLLMSARSRVPGPPLPTETPSSSGTAATPNRRQAIQQEEADLDRFAGFDDNIGVGMFKPENVSAAATTTSASRKRERADRMLKGRLGLLGKRKVVDGAARTKAEEVSDDDEGRSGIGKAKRRKKNGVDNVVPQMEVQAEDASVDGPAVEEDVAVTDETSVAEIMTDDLKGQNGEGVEDFAQPKESRERTEETIRDHPDKVVDSKKRRKKKKKKKPKNAADELDES